MSDGMWGYAMEVYCETESKGWQFKRTTHVTAAWGYKLVMWIRAVQQGFKSMIEGVFTMKFMALQK